MTLSEEQIQTLVQYRDSGQRQVVAARAAKCSRWQVSDWCKREGKPWPRTAVRRSMNQRRHANDQDLGQVQRRLEKSTARLLRSSNPQHRDFGEQLLRKVRDQPVTNRPVTSADGASSGYPIRKSSSES